MYERNLQSSAQTATPSAATSSSAPKSGTEMVQNGGYGNSNTATGYQQMMNGSAGSYANYSMPGHQTSNTSHMQQQAYQSSDYYSNGGSNTVSSSGHLLVAAGGGISQPQQHYYTSAQQSQQHGAESMQQYYTNGSGTGYTDYSQQYGQTGHYANGGQNGGHYVVDYSSQANIGDYQSQMYVEQMPLSLKATTTNGGSGGMTTASDAFGTMPYGTNAFVHGYHHCSPTSSSYTSTGSDESDDLYGFTLKRSPSNDFDANKAKRGKLSKKRKPKRDPNEPQKPVSAYALFFRDTQAAIKGQNPNASFGEVSKIVASMWDSLDTDAKNVYKQKTEAAKKDYLKQLAAYRASLVSKGSGGGNPVMESFAEFTQAHRKLLTSVQSSPDSTTNVQPGGCVLPVAMNGGHQQMNSAGHGAGDIGGKSLASLIAEPAPQQVLTATTTLTVPPSYVPLRTKADYDLDVEHSGAVLLRKPSVDESWDSGDYGGDYVHVTHCRDLLPSWTHVQAGTLQSQSTFAPV